MFLPLHDENALKHIQAHYVTIGLLIANAVAFLFSGALTGAMADVFVYSWGLVPDWLDGGRPPVVAGIPEPATLVTYAFLHADFWHLAGNMVFLWVFGDNVEDALGHARFLVFYLLCAIGAGFLHAVANWDSAAPLIGASGAVAGIVGAYLVLHPRVRVWVLVFKGIPLRLSAFWVLGAWVVMQVINVVRAPADSAVAWWAHLGGLGVGALLVVLMRRRGVRLFDGMFEDA